MGRPGASDVRRDPEERIEDSEALQHLNAGGLNRVRREGVAREAVLVDHADAKAGTREHRGEGAPAQRAPRRR
jgi:hypothetical protein